MGWVYLYFPLTLGKSKCQKINAKTAGGRCQRYTDIGIAQYITRAHLRSSDSRLSISEHNLKHCTKPITKRSLLKKSLKPPLPHGNHRPLLRSTRGLFYVAAPSDRAEPLLTQRDADLPTKPISHNIIPAVDLLLGPNPTPRSDVFNSNRKVIVTTSHATVAPVKRLTRVTYEQKSSEE